MINAILLNGYQFETIKISKKNGMKDVLDKLGINSLQGYFSFGKGYTAFWQEEREEETSMEITVYTRAVSQPMFVDSKVIITNEDTLVGELIDVDFRELRDYFNMDGSFWALMKIR